MKKRINTVQDFKNFVKDSNFSVTYRKADGQFRRAEANIAEVKSLVKGNGNEQAAETREDRGVVVYFDREHNGIRSFALDAMIKLIIGDQEYKFV